MGVHETNALKGDIYTTASRPYANTEEDANGNPRGKVIDLLIPIICLDSVLCYRNDLHRRLFQRS